MIAHSLGPPAQNLPNWPRFEGAFCDLVGKRAAVLLDRAIELLHLGLYRGRFLDLALALLKVIPLFRRYVDGLIRQDQHASRSGCNSSRGSERRRHDQLLQARGMGQSGRRSAEHGLVDEPDECPQAQTSCFSADEINTRLAERIENGRRRLDRTNPRNQRLRSNHSVGIVPGLKVKLQD
jgi:hypothetical protein